MIRDDFEEITKRLREIEQLPPPERAREYNNLVAGPLGKRAAEWLNTTWEREPREVSDFHGS